MGRNVTASGIYVGSRADFEALNAFLAKNLLKPHIDRVFEYADAPGYALVTVRGDEIRADIRVGLNRPPWKRLNLSALLSEG